MNTQSKPQSQFSVRALLLWTAIWAVLLAIRFVSTLPDNFFFGLFVLVMIAQVQILLPKIPPMLSSAIAGAACFTLAPILHGLAPPATMDIFLLGVIGAMAGFASGLFVTIAIEVACCRVWVAK